MAARLPDGATLFIGTGFGSAKTVSSITNANPGVATSAGHGFTDGDFVIMASGWSNLNERVIRIAGSATDAFNIGGIDTSSTERFPVGSSAGTATEVTAWTQISQILEMSTSGGDQQFANYSFLEQDFESQIPTITSAQSITIGIADDATLGGYQALKTAGEARAVRPMKLQLPGGSFILYYGYVSFNETPTVTKGQVMQVNATLSLNSRPVRYTS